MICLHDSSKIIAQTQNLVCLHFPLVKHWPPIFSKYNSIELIYLKLITDSNHKKQKVQSLIKSEISVTFSGYCALSIVDRPQNSNTLLDTFLCTTTYYMNYQSRWYFASHSKSTIHTALTWLGHVPEKGYMRNNKMSWNLYPTTVDFSGAD